MSLRQERGYGCIYHGIRFRSLQHDSARYSASPGVQRINKASKSVSLEGLHTTESGLHTLLGPRSYKYSTARRYYRKIIAHAHRNHRKKGEFDDRTIENRVRDASHMLTTTQDGRGSKLPHCSEQTRHMTLLPMARFEIAPYTMPPCAAASTDLDRHFVYSSATRSFVLGITR